MAYPNPPPAPVPSRVLGVLLGLILAAGLAACSGAAATPAPTAAPTAAPPVATKLFIDVDTVLGPKNLTDEEKPLKTCVQLSRFAHNEQVVWRVRVMDPVTGQALDDKALTGVNVQLPGEALAMRYGPHPSKNPVDYFWTVSWTVPAGYPSGTLAFSVAATGADGRTGTWEQMKVPAAMLTITDDVREEIPES